MKKEEKFNKSFFIKGNSMHNAPIATIKIETNGKIINVFHLFVVVVVVLFSPSFYSFR